MYNFERSHEALAMATPASRYTPSTRSFQELLAPIEYSPGDEIRTVQQGGRISYRNREHVLLKAFYGQHVALRPTSRDGLLDVFFCNYKIMHLDLKNHALKSVTHLPERL